MQVLFGLATPADQPQARYLHHSEVVAVARDNQQRARSDPGGNTSPLVGSMVALLCDQLMKRPDFAGIKSDPKAKGGDMGLQPISRSTASSRLTLAGPVPEDLFLHMDMAAAVAARTTQEKDARAYIAFLRAPENAALWKVHGVVPFWGMLLPVPCIRLSGGLVV